MCSKLTVIDIFCGAGGFSEGFRQQGYKILLGIDSWEPAIKTFNHNFGLNCKAKNVLDFEDSIEDIEALPDSDIIIGSPPCVTFSSSNISGKADKTSGIKLTQIFLKIVAVKKWQPRSKLKAWFMENVPSSIKHLGNEYTFDELGLGEWATKNKIGRSKVAIRLEENQRILNSADYGSAQSRERVLSGEIVKRKRLVIPPPTHNRERDNYMNLPLWRDLGSIIDYLPSPNCKNSSQKIVDPNYPNLSIALHELTDNFYDTGLFECEWRQSRFLKVNHPYMGKMAFPENKNRPSRTITATKIGTSREAIIYKSEYKRKGNGEYRTPTVREAACIMGFPITYQFCGGETTKWRLVGNAVCPSVSRAFAKQTLRELKLPEQSVPIVETITHMSENNLNTFSQKDFSIPPKRNKGSRFRRHPFKDGNITVTLSNYDIDKNEKTISKWITSVQYGNGEGFPIFNFPDYYYKNIEQTIITLPCGKEFIEIMKNGFSSQISKSKKLQEMYEKQLSQHPFLEPTELVENIAQIIENFDIEDEFYVQSELAIFSNKLIVPLKQVFALYAINKVSSFANKPR
ncbi:MAG: DNA (cytosine-5-)-methyltransferase [Bacteroidia bacterium 44-10]|nr:MAG: DNA (cytosine-5-)-methyltransferase [Bacteroidia bacterium 44-10]